MIITYEPVGESYERYVDSSGVTVLLYPMKGYRGAYALFGTKYGSIDQHFAKEGEPFSSVPAGIAHYLEHKLFESEECDAFSLFSKTGASANAYTSFDKTVYLFSCTERFEESFEILLNFVQSPYFTKENVQKEQGIIAQEIKMYDDDPGWQVFFRLLGALYHRNGVKTDIAGTVESISHITPELLYRCYDAFYDPSNMVIAVAGNFPVEKTKDMIASLMKKASKGKIISRMEEEPETSVCPRTETFMEVSLPLFQFGYKLSPDEDSYSFLKTQMEWEILLEMLVGASSDFYDTLYNEGLLNATFDAEVFSGRGFLALLFGGESKKPEEVFSRFREMIRQAKEKGLDEAAFLSAKNGLYGKYLKGLNDAEGIAADLINSEMAGVGLFDPFHILSKLTLSDLNQRLNKAFDEKTAALSLILPKSQIEQE